MLALFLFSGFSSAAQYCHQIQQTMAEVSGYKTCNNANQQCVTSESQQASCNGSWQLAGPYYGTFVSGTTCNGYRASDNQYVGTRVTLASMICPAGYSGPSNGICTLVDPNQVDCIKAQCGSEGTTYAVDYPSRCTIGEAPVECPGLGEIHHPVTGQCFEPPWCDPPYTLSADQTACEAPKCDPNKSGGWQQWNDQLKRCVANPPTCGPNQHLVGNSKSEMVFCEDNPQCPEGMTYGCFGIGAGPNTGAGLGKTCSCWGPQHCPEGQTWGAVNGIAGCYGKHLDPKPLPQVPPGQPPNTTPTPPSGGKCTNCGQAEYPPSSSSSSSGGSSGGGSGGGSTGGTTASKANSETGEGAANGTGSGRGGMCQGGACLCNPKAAALPQSEVKCPSSGWCPPDYYSTSSGSCSKSPGDCGNGQHFEYESLSCVSDTSMKNAKDQGDEAITQRLDKIIENTKQTYKNLELPALATQTAGSFGSEAQEALTAAKAEFQAKYDEVKAGLQGMVGTLSGGSGLPVFNMGTVKGQQVVHDMNRWAEQLSYVGLAVLALAALVAFEIVFKRGT